MLMCGLPFSSPFIDLLPMRKALKTRIVVSGRTKTRVAIDRLQQPMQPVLMAMGTERGRRGKSAQLFASLK
jgi:hypothetical protein